MSPPESVVGRQLLALLPEVYRTRDVEGHFAEYLDACGELFDMIRNTLDQLLADSFPDEPLTGRAAQEWVLPYLAQLVNVHLMSPHAKGRRQEVSRAIAWRQRKGTVCSVEEIAEAVGQWEAEVQEGWRRVAVTPRVEIPLTPAAVFGEPEPDPTNALQASGHPGLPAITPDLARPMRAVRCAPERPGAHRTCFGGSPHYWRHSNRHGAPCFTGSFDDISRLTPDLRTPGWSSGHAHPRRALLFVPPPQGFFALGEVTLMWGERHDPIHENHTADLVEDGKRRVFNPSKQHSAGADPVDVTITTNPSVFHEEEVVIAGLNFDATLTVDGGRVALQEVAARKLVVETAGVDEPVIVARDCFFEEVEAASGLVRLEYTTVADSLACRRLLASDSILAGDVSLTGNRGDRNLSCVRFSRIPKSLKHILAENRRPRTTTDRPALYDFTVCDESGAKCDSLDFGVPGHGVLHPACADSIRFGAEDGGEMGAYHHRHYCLQWLAVLEKLKGFLPVGIEAVLVPDSRLLSVPPETPE